MTPGRPLLSVLAGVLLAGALPAGAADAPATNALPLLAADAARYLTAGRAAIEDGLHELAQKQLEKYLALSPPPGAESAEAVEWLLRAYHAQGFHDRMIKLLETAGAQLAVRDPAAPDYWQAVARYGRGELDKTLALLAGAEGSAGGKSYAAQIQRLKAWALLKSGQTDAAVKIFQGVITGPDGRQVEPQEQLAWAQALLGRGVVDPAAEILARLSESGPDPRLLTEIRYWLGQARLRQGRPAEAAVQLAPVMADLSARPDLRAEAAFGLAAACQVATNAPQALTALTNGLGLAQDPAVRRKGLRALGLLHLGEGNVDAAAPPLREFIAAAPSDAEAGPMQLRLAAAYLNTNCWDAAVREYQRYVESFTNEAGQAEAQEGMGWALAGLGRHAEAAAAYQRAYQRATNPVDRARCLAKEADSCFANAQFSLAGEAYQRVCTEFPQSDLVPRARFQIGECLARGGDAARAEEAFLKFANELPDSPLAEEALLRVADLRQTGKRVDEAAKALDQAINTYTNGALLDRALISRGLANYQRYRFQLALEDFQRVTTQFPTNRAAEEASYWAAMCLYWTGRDDEATAAAKQFIVKYADSSWIPTVLFWMGRHEFNRTAYASAEEWFGRFVEKSPADPRAADALLWAGRAAAMRQEFLRAIEWVTRLVKEYPATRQVAEARYIQGDALCNLAKFAEAILVFEDILVKYPDSEVVPQTWLRKGDAQFMLGSETAARFDEALRSYRVVAADSQAPPEIALQAEYKVGRCFEKLGRIDDAVEQYYTKVMVRFLAERDKGVRHSEVAKLWFTRAAFNAADVLEARAEWRQAVTILERLTDSGIPVSEEVRARVKKIRSEHWWLFY